MNFLKRLSFSVHVHPIEVLIATIFMAALVFTPMGTPVPSPAKAPVKSLVHAQPPAHPWVGLPAGMNEYLVCLTQRPGVYKFTIVDSMDGKNGRGGNVNLDSIVLTESFPEGLVLAGKVYMMTVERGYLQGPVASTTITGMHCNR